MKKRVLGVGLGILFASLVFAENGFAQARNKEVAVVEYKKYEWKNTNYYYKHYTLPLFNTIKDLGLSPEWVSMDIFLPENKSKRDGYKRIVISSAGLWFSPEMYEGMTDYVKNGGLLITNSEMGGIDVNGNYKPDKGDSRVKRSGNPLVGVYGQSGVYMTKIKVEVTCPLTEGIPVGEWIDLEAKAGGRMTTNRSATALITSDSIYKDKPSGNQSFLAYKHSGKGACIYIVPGLGSAKSKYRSIILKNVLSKKTLNWLTVDWVDALVTSTEIPNNVFVVAASDSKDKTKADYVCDGLGDQEEINAAIAALPAEGGTVLLLEGIYDIRKGKKIKALNNREWVECVLGGIIIDKSNICLKGSGWGTKLILADKQCVNVIRVIGMGIGNIVIRDLYIDANRAKNPRTLIKGIKFEGNGIKVTAGFGSSIKPWIHDVTIDSCKVLNATYLGIMPYGKNMIVINNHVANANSDCIEVLGGPATVSNNVVINKKGDRSHVGIGTDGCNDVIISNNKVICDGGSYNLAIRIWGGTRNTRIENNQVICKSGRIDKGLDIRGNLTTITGNRVNCVGGSIGEVLITGHTSTVSGNKFENCGQIRIQSDLPAQGPIILKGNHLYNTFINAATDNVKMEAGNTIQITPVTAKEATIRQTAVSPVIDGKLDDECWEEADMFKDFIYTKGYGRKRRGLAKEQTVACLTYDSKNLYIAFKCFESKIGSLCANIKEHDEKVEEDDSVGVFLDTNHDRRTYYYILVNSLGICEEKKAKYGIREEWNPQIRVKTSVEDTFWAVEMAIPFSELKTTSLKGKIWGINLARSHAAGMKKNKYFSPWNFSSLWNYPDYKSPHVPHRFGSMRFTIGKGI